MRFPLHLSRYSFLGISAVLTVAACAHAQQPTGPGPAPTTIQATHIVASDGYELPLHHWRTEEEARGVVLALHGFNDYGGAFEVLAPALNAEGLHLYAYDQRGFGANEPRGIWAGQELLIRDATETVALLRQRYPALPIYLLGKSMGAAVSLLALEAGGEDFVSGSILIAPAVWGWDSMDWYHRFGLWLGETLMPGLPLSVEISQAMGILPTDDKKVLKAMRDNPKVQRAARMDAMYGLAEMMEAAHDAARALPSPALILYGERDTIVPPEAICELLTELPIGQQRSWRMLLYNDGYHMLTRYSGSEAVHRDIVAWLRAPDGDLPSRAGVSPGEAVSRLCD